MARRQDIPSCIMKSLDGKRTNESIRPSRVIEHPRTYHAEQIPGMALTAKKAEAWLPLVNRGQTPYPYGSVIRGGSDEQRVVRRCNEIINSLDRKRY